MHTLQRHIFTSVLFACAAAVGVFAFVFMAVNGTKDLLSYVLAGQLTPGEVVHLFLLLVPFVLAFALPMGLLTGVLLVLGRMSAQQEITAARAAGLSFGYVTRPVLLLGGLAMLLALAVNYSFLPRARVAYHELLTDTLRTKPLNLIVPKTAIRDFPGWVVYIGDKDGGILHDCWVWRLDEQKRVIQFLKAKSGHIDYTPEDGRLQITLTECTVEERDATDPEDFSKPNSIATVGQAGPIELKNFFNTQTFTKKQAWFTVSELLAEHARLVAAPPSPERDRAVMQVLITLNEKGALALSVFSLTLLAVPLGIRVSRKETTANLALAILCALGYYFLTVMVSWLNNKPALRPDLLLWVPNLVLLAVGAGLYRRLDRR